MGFRALKNRKEFVGSGVLNKISDLEKCEGLKSIKRQLNLLNNNIDN